MPKIAIILFNLGGPDSPEAVRPFLQNLFSDPAIIDLPGPLRRLVAWIIARRRAPVAGQIYARLGGSSPILANTEAQARALEAALGPDYRCFVAMRHWKPMADEAARLAKDWGADELVLLPLYPQYSTTTTASSLGDWRRAASRAGLALPTHTICCYPREIGFVSTLAGGVRAAMVSLPAGSRARILFSAHGLPEKIVAGGDPYQWQIERTAAAIMEKLAPERPDHVICYQSRVGPLAWLQPSTDAEIRRAGADRAAVVLVPLSFVSEHSETLVELDIEYRHLAEAVGVPAFVRVPTVSAAGNFIAGLAERVRGAVATGGVASGEGGRLCPGSFRRCALALPA